MDKGLGEKRGLGEKFCNGRGVMFHSALSGLWGVSVRVRYVALLGLGCSRVVRGFGVVERSEGLSSIPCIEPQGPGRSGV